MPPPPRRPGPGFRRMPIGGPPPPGAHPPHPWFCWPCFFCCWCCFPPPPPPHPVNPPPGPPVVNVINEPTPYSPGGNRINNKTQQAKIEETPDRPVYREIMALEYREGDPAVRYFLKVPQDIEYDHTIQVDLGGRVMSVKIPDYINKGEKIIIVAPAP